MIKNKAILEMLEKKSRKYHVKTVNIVIWQLITVESGIVQKQAYLMLMWFLNNVSKKVIRI